MPALPGHDKARLFITHGGQNSLLQAVYHAVPVLGIPLFGDQFDNVVRAEAKGLGLTINPTQITRELLSSTIQTIIQDTRFVDTFDGRTVDGNVCRLLQISLVSPIISPFLGSSLQLCPLAGSTDQILSLQHFDLSSGWSTFCTVEVELI